MSDRDARSDDAARREASDWVVVIHDPDAAVDRAAFERWRAADPQHAKAYARAERAWDIAALLGRTSFGRARGLPERRRWFERPQVRYALTAAAVLVVAIFGLSVGGGRLVGPDRALQGTELASSVGQIRKITLTDGSTVTLDTDSVLRVAFSGDERRLYLSRGRARFDVEHEPARPFVVIARGGSVTARGTMFDVDVADGRLSVTLLRGTVDVRRDIGDVPNLRSAPVTRLRPGQQLSLSAAALPISRPAVADDQWPSGMLTFDRTRLGDAVALANRYSATKIRVADPALNELCITGAYHVGDVDRFAGSVAASLGLNVARTARHDLVISSASPISQH